MYNLLGVDLYTFHANILEVLLHQYQTAIQSA